MDQEILMKIVKRSKVYVFWVILALTVWQVVEHKRGVVQDKTIGEVQRGPLMDEWMMENK